MLKKKKKRSFFLGIKMMEIDCSRLTFLLDFCNGNEKEKNYYNRDKDERNYLIKD